MKTLAVFDELLYAGGRSKKGATLPAKVENMKAAGKQLSKLGGQEAQPCRKTICALCLVVESFQTRGNDVFPFGCF